MRAQRASGTLACAVELVRAVSAAGPLYGARQAAALARPASTVPRPSFRSCQVEPMACTSRYALPKSYLRVGCHCPRQPLFSSAYPLDEFSCLAWPIQRPAHVRQKICAVDFPPTIPQRHKSALPIFRTGGMAAIAPMSRPTVFFVKPWTV